MPWQIKLIKIYSWRLQGFYYSYSFYLSYKLFSLLLISKINPRITNKKPHAARKFRLIYLYKNYIKNPCIPT